VTDCFPFKMDKFAALKARVAAAVGNNSKGGLAVGLHPALEDLGSVKPLNEQRKSVASRSNPYLDHTPPGQGPAVTEKRARTLEFNPKGKYIREYNCMGTPPSPNPLFLYRGQDGSFAQSLRRSL
jgi:hypothetical protein